MYRLICANILYIVISPIFISIDIIDNIWCSMRKYYKKTYFLIYIEKPFKQECKKYLGFNHIELHRKCTIPLFYGYKRIYKCIKGNKNLYYKDTQLREMIEYKKMVHAMKLEVRIKEKILDLTDIQTDIMGMIKKNLNH